MSKEKQYFAEVSYDMVVLITSSDYDVELGEFGPEGRVREDLENLGRTHGVPVAFHDVQNENEFQGVVSSYASKDTLPLFYFYMHGSEDNGLTFSDNSMISWGRVTDLLRTINVRWKNKLLILSTCCFSFQLAVGTVELLRPAPFSALIAPISEINIGEIEQGAIQFFRDIFSGHDLRHAIEGNFPSCSFFSAEMFLFQGIVNYNIELCNSRVAQKRAEALVSQSKAEGRILIGESPRGARRFFKKAIRKGMTDGTFDKIVSTYLIGRQPSFGLADVERETRRRRAKRTETAR